MRRVINFFVFTLAAVLFPASIVMANAQGESPRLQMHWEEGSLHISSHLSRTYWGDSNGQAKVTVSTGPEGKKKSQDVPAPYQIKNHILLVDIPYQRPSDKELEITVKITGIKDLDNKDKVIFTGSSVLKAVTPPISADTDPSTNTNKDSETSTPAPTSTPSPTVSQTPENQPSNGATNLASSWKLWIAGNTVALILAFLGWLHLSRKLQTISSKSTSAKQIQAASLPNEWLQKIEQRMKEVEEKLKEWASADSSQTSNSILDLLGTEGDFDHLIEIAVARSLPVHTRSSAFGHSYSRATTDADVTTAAVINSWLAEGRRDRSDLVQRTQALGLKSHLFSLRNPNEWRPESFEYAFEANADGAWLATPIAGSNEIWLAPADVSLLGMGKAPSILQSLFDGMENASSGFRFEAIYAPCRLRPAIGKNCVYTLVNRGILQLAGDSAPSSLGMPPRIQSSNRPRSSAALQPVPDADGRTAPVARLLAAWMKAITAEIVEQAGNLQKLRNAHEEIAQSIAPAVPAMDEHAIKKLNEELAALRNNVIELGKTTSSMQSEVKAGMGNIPWQIKRAINKLREELQTPAHNQPVHSASSIQAVLSEPDPATELTNDGSVKILKSVSDVPKAVLETPKADGSVTKPAPAVDALALMPVGWERAWREAANQGSSQPDFMDIPNPGLYVMRLLNLQQALQGYQTSIRVSLVHLFIRRTEGEVFELHETSMDEGRLVCKRCDTNSMWQFAVCVRVNSNFQMRVFYPMGNYGKSNFSTGYELLIANPPSPSFSIDEPCFAELRCKNQQAMTFEVWQAIQCAKPLTLAEGRP